MQRLIATTSLLAALMLVSSSAVAGPPCVCWPVEVGDAPTLETENRTPTQIADDTLRLLKPSLPVLARMEVLRRSAAALQGEPVLVDRVFGRLCARVLDVETGKAEHPGRAWFDAGYAAQAFQQAGMLNRHGYDWIAKGLEKAAEADKGAMHFGAALTCLMKPHPRHRNFGAHLGKMRAAAASDPLLQKNFDIVSKRYPPLLKYFDKKN